MMLGDETYTIGGREYANTLLADVRINQGDLSGDFQVHPEKFAYWATLYELSVDEENRLKREVEQDYARVDHLVRQEAKECGVKLTEKMVENTVITHPNYVETYEKYLAAKRTSGLLKAARDAMIHRRDMLIQLGATSRAEGQSDITIRDRENSARSIIGR